MALHCPATLLLAPAPHDAKGARDLTASLAGERVLAVVGPPGVAAGRQLADALGVPLEDEPGLASADPSVLESIADLHRGETVLVLTHSSGETPFARLEIG